MGIGVGMQKRMFELFISWERTQARLIRKSLAINEGEISYLEGGNGPTLVLLHGFGADKDNWNRLAKSLTRHFHVIAIDIPGFGDSFSPLEGFDIGWQVVRVNAFLKLKKVRDFTLIGNSYGGYISAILASCFPINIKNCILISPLGIENAALTPMFKDVVNGCSPLLLPRNLNELRHLLKACFYKAPFIPKFALKQMLERNLVKSILHYNFFYQTHFIFNGRLQFDYKLEELLTDIKIPIHVIWGDRDAVLSAEGLKVLACCENEFITLKCLENVGHLPQLEVPKFLSNLIIDAVKSIKSTQI
jgi:pimeloyl-ACP methyl ester carboxylesterase